MGQTNLNLQWSDEFDGPVGSRPESANWAYDLGDSGWGNSELQNYTDLPENACIVADTDATGGKCLQIAALQVNGKYTSARIKTHGKREFTYGRFEARLKLPMGNGLWPAFWLLGRNINHVPWPHCGEIDIMEHVGKTPFTVGGALHASHYHGGAAKAFKTQSGPTPWGQDFHIYALDWRPDGLTWSVDGNAYGKAACRPPFDQPFFITLNLAVGGIPAGEPDDSTRFPQAYKIDYVRVYE